MPSKFTLAALAAAAFATALPVHAAQRTFVSTGGSDSGTCSPVAPCHTFATAMSHTDANGEIIVLDSGGYGQVTIGQSIAITAPPGVYAGISVFSGNGVTIATPGVRVVLRGLAINGLGGATGISFSQGELLQIERCTIAAMSASGISATAANATVVVNDSVVSDSGAKGVSLVASAMTATLERVRIERTSGDGLYLSGGIKASIRDATIVGNSGSGISASDSAAAGTTLTVSHSLVADNGQYGANVTASQGRTMRTSISDSEFARNAQGGIAASTSNFGSVAYIDVTRTTVSWNNGDGIFFESQTLGLTRAGVSGCTIANNSGDGIHVTGGGTLAVVSASMLLHNSGFGFHQASGAFHTRSDNTIETGGTPTSGTITTVPAY